MPTASMLSFCRSLRDVESWVAPALSKITSVLSVPLKLKRFAPVRSAKALAWASLISKARALGKPRALLLEAESAASKVAMLAVLAVRLAALSCSRLIESMPLAAKLSKLAVRAALPGTVLLRLLSSVNWPS